MGDVHILFSTPRPRNERGRRILVGQSEQHNQSGTATVTPEERRIGERIWEAAQEFIGLPEPEKEMLFWGAVIDWVYKRSGIEHHEHRRRDVREQIARLLMIRAYGSGYAARMLAEPRFREIADLLPLDKEE